MNREDIRVLRELGKIIKDIAADPVNEERKLLWKRLNGLERTRPPVFIFEIPWHEMDYGNELTPLCRDPFFKKIEVDARRTIYQWRHMPCDMVVEGYIPSPPVIISTRMCPEEDVIISSTDKRSSIVSRRFNAQISGEADLENIKLPVVSFDEEETERNFKLLNEIFSGIIPVRKTGIKYTSVAPWDLLARMTGIQEILIDMAGRPAYVHKAAARITEAFLSLLDQYEKMNLLALNNDNTNLGGGLQYTDELPGRDYVPGRARAADMWGRTMSQIFSSVSPAMHEEFALQYEIKYLCRFGLVYYGCCEPLHRKIEILRKIPNLRKVSMSPWADAREGAEAIGSDYVYSMKPNPALLAGSSWSAEKAVEDLEDNLRKTRNCPREIILKDISTVNYKPQRLWEWARIAMNAALASS